MTEPLDLEPIKQRAIQAAIDLIDGDSDTESQRDVFPLIKEVERLRGEVEQLQESLEGAYDLTLEMPQ